MKFRAIVDYEYPIEHKPPVKAELILHGDRVVTDSIEPLPQEPFINKPCVSSGEGMKKTVEISIDLFPDDIAEYITEGNDSEQAEVIYLLAHKYYNDPHGFVAEVKHIRDYIKDCYNHEVQNKIKRMIKDIYEVFWEGEDGND